MTYLELVKRLRQETNYANTGPGTVTGQTGDHERAVAWVASYYTELQNRNLWRWLRKGFTLTTVADQSTYGSGDCTDTPTSSAISRFKRWVMDARNPMRCYLQSSGSGTEFWLTPVSWDYFRTIYQIGTQPSGAPNFITIDPDDNIVLGPTPNDTYVITGEYHRSAQVLAADEDIPEMPEDYHIAIVYGAMEKFGLYDAAPEVVSRAQVEGRRLIRQLESTQLPRMLRAGPMA